MTFGANHSHKGGGELLNLARDLIYNAVEFFFSGNISVCLFEFSLRADEQRHSAKIVANDFAKRMSHTAHSLT